jgi:hypothetical protein
VPNERFTHSVSHHLKLALAGQVLHYAVCDKNNTLLTSGERYLADGKALQELFDRDDVLSGIYAGTQLMIMSPKFIHVPEHYARHDHNYNLFKLSNKASAEERLFRDHSIEQKEVQYSGHREFMRLIQNKFPNILKIHLSSFLHTQSLSLKSELSNLLQLFVLDDFLFITASNAKGVLLSNAYHVVNSEELFYFCMLSMEQLKLEPTNTELYLYQLEFKEQSLENLFKNYFQKISSNREASKGTMHIWNSCE